jgi:hypothetical protein
MKTGTSALTETPRRLADAAGPVLEVISEPGDLVRSAIDQLDVSEVADTMTSAAETAAAPLRRNMRRVVAVMVLVAVAVGALALWKVIRRGGEPEQLEPITDRPISDRESRRG